MQTGKYVNTRARQVRKHTKDASTPNTLASKHTSTQVRKHESTTSAQGHQAREHAKRVCKQAHGALEHESTRARKAHNPAKRNLTDFSWTASVKLFWYFHYQTQHSRPLELCEREVLKFFKKFTAVKEFF